MFIFSRDFSHPRQKISAKCQPFSNSKVHFNHSPIRQKNYNMSNTFYKIPKYMISTFCHLAKHFTSKNGSFFVFFGNLQRGFSPQKNLRNETLRNGHPVTDLAPQLRGRATAIGVLPTAHPFATNFQLTTFAGVAVSALGL